MKTFAAICAALVLSLTAATSWALPGNFVIDQIYSNVDGTVQFIVVFDSGRVDCDAGEAGWTGQTLVSTGPGPQKTFVFSHDLPTCKTSQKRMLIASEGFAALGLITPDFVIPNGFMQIPSGAVYLADVDGVIYTALPTDGVTAITNQGKPVHNVATNLSGASVSLALPATPVLLTVVEFYNAALNHYFITWATDEIAKLDAGTIIKGWTRTGQSFKTYTSAQPGTSPVCRYYIPPALGDSHFFGRGTTECNSTGEKNPSFVLEDPAFMQLFLPTAGVCPTNTTEVYRVFSNRADANHRYMTDKAVRQMMVDQGWLAEGDGPNLVVMCAPQ